MLPLFIDQINHFLNSPRAFSKYALSAGFQVCGLGWAGGFSVAVGCYVQLGRGVTRKQAAAGHINHPHMVKQCSRFTHPFDQGVTVGDGRHGSSTWFTHCVLRSIYTSTDVGELEIGKLSSYVIRGSSRC